MEVKKAALLGATFATLCSFTVLARGCPSKRDPCIAAANSRGRLEVQEGNEDFKSKLPRIPKGAVS